MNIRRRRQQGSLKDQRHRDEGEMMTARFLRHRLGCRGDDDVDADEDPLDVEDEYEVWMRIFWPTLGVDKIPTMIVDNKD